MTPGRWTDSNLPKGWPRPLDVVCPLCGKLTRPGLLAQCLVDLGHGHDRATRPSCDAASLLVAWPGPNPDVPAYTRCCFRPAKFDRGTTPWTVVPFPDGLALRR